MTWLILSPCALTLATVLGLVLALSTRREEPLGLARKGLIFRIMLVTILETGRAPGPLSETHPLYPDMFASLLSQVDEGLRFRTVALVDGEALPDPASCEGVVITGSPAGVYDTTPWMDPLRGFIRGAFAAKTPMIGVCFGHQIIADAMGGAVRKSEKGWGVGRHTYDVLGAPAWMVDAGATVALSVSHQDQVIAPPKGAVTLARSAHTDYAMLAYDGAPVMSLQGHPEFSDEFVAALYSARRGKSLSDAQVDDAIASLSSPVDRVLVGQWMARFLRTSR
jgi:GMP synthase-like glutamine amidotransferase